MSKSYGGVLEPGVAAGKTVWGHAAGAAGSTPYQNPENILRKTGMFGVLKVVGGKVVMPTDPPDKVNQFGLIDPKDIKPGDFVYYPDLLNDLQLTDHYPLLQQTAIGTVCTLNLMKQCRAFDGGGYNNAFNKVETPAEYQARLDKLADLVIAMVKENGITAFTFQEAPNGVEGKAFYEKIERETGCKFAVDTASRNNFGLVTLYDPKKLTPTPTVTPATKEAKEQRIEFSKVGASAADKSLVITNVHWQLDKAPAGLERMKAAMAAANDPNAKHDLLVLGDTNFCANAYAREKLKGVKDGPKNATAHANAPVDPTMIGAGATSYIEGSLVASKGGVTTADIAFGSAGVVGPAHGSVQQTLVHAGDPAFQIAMEAARQDNVSHFDPGVDDKMKAVAGMKVDKPIAGYQAHGPDADKLSALCAALSDKKYGFDPNGANPGTPEYDARQARREALRVFHGHAKTEEGKSPKPSDDGANAPIRQLLSGAIAQYALAGGGHIDGADVKKRQADIQIEINRERILEGLIANGVKDKTPADIVHDIQLLKNGRDAEVKLPSGKTAEEYKSLLEQLGSYVVLRGVVKQHYDAKGEPIAGSGRDVPLYYANFPKLTGDSKDYHHFCTGPYGDGKASLDPNKTEALTQKFKDIILLQMAVAAKNGEALDIVTPNAFFAGLKADEQTKAKQLFADAVVAATKEFKPPQGDKGFKGLFVHDSPGMADKVAAAGKDLKVPVVVGNGDALAPNRACHDGGSALRVGVAVMGEAVGPAGNGSLGSRANKAAEENINRMCMGELAMVFGGYNQAVYDLGKKVALSPEEEAKARLAQEVKWQEKQKADAAAKDTAPKGADAKSAAATESFDVLKGLDAAKKQKILEEAMADAAKSDALKKLGVTFADIKVAAKEAEHTITLKVTFPGDKGAPPITKDVTLTRSASDDGKEVVRTCKGEGLTADQRYAIIAAASFQERAKVGAPINTRIAVSIESKGTPGKEGLTDDERALVKAYLAAGYTEVYCGKDNKCFTKDDFKELAAPDIRERPMQSWRSAAQGKPSGEVTFDNLMQLAKAVQLAVDDAVRTAELKKFEATVVDYVKQKGDKAPQEAGTKIASQPRADRELAMHVAGVVNDIKAGKDPSAAARDFAEEIKLKADDPQPS